VAGEGFQQKRQANARGDKNETAIRLFFLRGFNPLIF